MPKRVLIGTIVSDKGDKTVTVRVDRRVKHPLYGKIIRRSKKYHAHDADNAYRTGEQVRIEECKPISKQKSWTVIERLGAAKAVAVEIDEPDMAAPTAPAVNPPVTGTGTGSITPPNTGDAGLAATNSGTSSLFVIAGAMALMLAGLATFKFSHDR